MKVFLTINLELADETIWCEISDNMWTKPLLINLLIDNQSHSSEIKEKIFYNKIDFEYDNHDIVLLEKWSNWGILYSKETENC